MMRRPFGPTASAAAQASAKARSPPRKSGTLRRPSSATRPTQPSLPGENRLSAAGVPTTTWARGSARETVSLGKRRETAASTRSGSQPRGDSRCPPQRGQRSGTGSAFAQSRQRSAFVSRENASGTPQSPHRISAPHSGQRRAPARRVTTRSTRRPRRVMSSMPRVSGKVSG